MATNPRKTPNDAALSAVEEALRLDFGAVEEGEKERSAGAPAPRNPRPRTAPPSRGSAPPRGAADARPAPPDRAAAAPPRRGARARSSTKLAAHDCHPPPPQGAPQAQAQPQAARRRRPPPGPSPRRRAARPWPLRRQRRSPYRCRSRRLPAPSVAPDLPDRDGRVGALGRPRHRHGHFRRRLCRRLLARHARHAELRPPAPPPGRLLWAIATMVWRAQEMRIVSRQIFRPRRQAVRAGEHHHGFRGQCSQAIRREVHSRGR